LVGQLKGISDGYSMKVSITNSTAHAETYHNKKNQHLTYCRVK